MARKAEEYSDGVGGVEGSSEWESDFGRGREAVEEFVVGLMERESPLTSDMGMVSGGDTSFKPCWMELGAVGLGSVIEVVNVYVEKAVGWTDEQREHVAGEVSRLMVEPAAAFVRGLNGSGDEDFRFQADVELAEAKSLFEQAMLSGDPGKGRVARALLNQVQRDAEGVAKG